MYIYIFIKANICIVNIECIELIINTAVYTLEEL